jgi:glycosyltransferase involved in cell wall biosynthesis
MATRCGVFLASDSFLVATKSEVFLSHTASPYGAGASLSALRGSLYPDSLLVQPSAAPGSAPRSSVGRTVQIDMPWAMVHHYEWRPRVILRWFARYFRSRRELRRLLEAERPSFLHSNSALLTIGAEAAASTGIPHLWHLREFGDLDYGLQWFVPRFHHQKLLRKASAIICVSRAVAEHYGAAGLSQAHVLYNGVMRREEMGFLKTERTPHKPFRFGCVGILSDAKGFDLAIRALSKCGDNDAELLIFGDGPDYMRRKLQDEVMRCGVSNRVRLEGFVKDSHEIYSRIDCLLVTSRFEAFGRTTAEAMALGIPIIGRNSGGTAELIEHGKDGLLFGGSEEELATQMNEVRRAYAQALERSERGLTKARAAFSIEAYADGFRQIAAPSV